jgi:hypothetical protein
VTPRSPAPGARGVTAAADRGDDLDRLLHAVGLKIAA